MRVLVTGAFGQVGGRVAQYLSGSGQHHVLLGTRTPGESPAWLPEAPVVHTDWQSSAALEAICANVDAIVHLSGMNAQDCHADPVGALDVNGTHTVRLLRAARRKNVRRFIYASTAQVYGNSLKGTITETTCAAGLHSYATSHRAGEDVVRAAHQRGEIEGIVVRLSNSYGAPAHPGANGWMLLINDLCRQAVTTRQLTLRSSGLQRRDFVPLTDVCRAFEHLLQLPAVSVGAGLFNIGGLWAPTVWEVACLVQDRCGKVLGERPSLARVPPSPGETSDALDFRIDLLLGTGFRLVADNPGEIDRLLEFCTTSFLAS